MRNDSKKGLEAEVHTFGLSRLTWKGKLKVQVGNRDDEKFSFGQVFFFFEMPLI